MVIPAEAVEKACEWNRYCRYVGPLHTGPAVQVGVGRPSVVGKCYQCGRYVCNRCAGRTGQQTLVAGLWRAGVWTLACPFDGTPLGRGGTWSLTGVAPAMVLRLSREPGFEEWCQVLESPLESAAQAKASALVDSWSAGRDEEIAEASDAGLPEELGPLIAMMRRQSLEGLRRFDEAWAIQQRLLEAPPVAFLRGIGHALRLLTPGRRRDILVQEMKQLAEREGTGIEAVLSRFSSGLTDALERSEPTGRAPPVGHPVAANATEGYVRLARPRRTVPLPDLPALAPDDSGPSPRDPLGSIEGYVLRCALAAPEWSGRGQDEDALLLPLEHLAGDRLELEGLDRTTGLRAIAEACPLVVERDAGFGFAQAVYAEAFLARRLGRLLFRSDPPDLMSLGSSPLSLGTAEFLADLVARDADHRARLDEWLRFRRQRRSQFRGADIPVFLRNLALVRYAMDGDLRGQDLHELDFRDLDLTGADFRDAVLDGAVLRNAGLRGARFAGASLNGTDLQGADLDGSDLERR